MPHLNFFVTVRHNNNELEVRIMVNKSRAAQYKYTVSMAYLDQKNGKSTEIKTECVKFIIIDHNYETNYMPIIYSNLKLERKLVDDMILNCNNNLIMLALFKYDDLTAEKQEIECFRKKFTYFLPNDVNKHDSIDYTEETESQNLGDTYRDITLGLMCIDHINNNKRSFKILRKNTTIGQAVDEIMEPFDNLIMEPIGDSTIIPQLMIPEKNSVSKALTALNNIRVLYDTPYRYYQDFNFTYLLSSSGRAIKKSGDIYTSVIFEIEDIISNTANDVGIIINKSSQTFQIPVNYVNTEVYDNSIINKSQTNLIGMTSSGAVKTSLKNKANYSTDKDTTIRLHNDNEGMLNNIAASKNNNNFLVYIQKTDLDTEVLSPNKRITIHHIDRYKEHNGDYLMYRKRECYLREDSSFTLNTMINLKEIYKE